MIDRQSEPAVRALEVRLPLANYEHQAFAHEINHGCWPAPTVGGETLMIPVRIYNPSPRDRLTYSYWADYHRRRYVSPQDYPAIRVLSRLRSPDASA